MKTRMVFLIVFMMILTACNTQVTITPEATVPPPATQGPSSTPDLLLFQDDFSNAIDPAWGWIRENEQAWSLENNPGWLEIEAGSGHVIAGEAENILIRQVPAGDFELETKLDFKPVTNYQFAGLLIFENDDNYIQFGRAFCINDPRCVGDGLYLDNTSGGQFIIGDNYSTPAPNVNILYLRLRREGNDYTSFFSEDGNTWQALGTHTNYMEPVSVGLVAGQSSYSFQPAKFDYISITALP